MVNDTLKKKKKTDMRNIIIITKILSCILMCLSAYQSSSMIDESNNSILDSDTNVIVKSEFEKLFTESDKSYESADIESNDVKKEFSESV